MRRLGNGIANNPPNPALTENETSRQREGFQAVSSPLVAGDTRGRYPPHRLVEASGVLFHLRMGSSPGRNSWRTNEVVARRERFVLFFLDKSWRGTVVLATDIIMPRAVMKLSCKTLTYCESDGDHLFPCFFVVSLRAAKRPFQLEREHPQQ